MTDNGTPTRDRRAVLLQWSVIGYLLSVIHSKYSQPLPHQCPSQRRHCRRRLDLDAIQSERIGAFRAHTALSAHGAPISRLLRQRAHVATLIAEWIREHVHVAIEQFRQ